MAEDCMGQDCALCYPASVWDFLIGSHIQLFILDYSKMTINNYFAYSRVKLVFDHVLNSPKSQGVVSRSVHKSHIFKTTLSNHPITTSFLSPPCMRRCLYRFPLWDYLRGSPVNWRATRGCAIPVRSYSALPLRSAVSSQLERASRALSTDAETQHGDSTIYALSTATGRAAIAIVRVSGPACLKVSLSCRTERSRIGLCALAM
jgi:hypothetical protein